MTGVVSEPLLSTVRYPVTEAQDTTNYWRYGRMSLAASADGRIKQSYDADDRHWRLESYGPRTNSYSFVDLTY